MRLLPWLSCLLLFTLPCVASAATTVLANSESVALREKAAKSADPLAMLMRYQPVDILARKGNWTQVKTTLGQTGWVLSSFLTDNAFVSAVDDKLNARVGPGSDYDTIIEYRKDFPVRVLNIAPNGWLMVMDYDHDRGWINPKMVKGKPRSVIVRENKASIRKGVGIGQDLLCYADKGVTLQPLDEKNGWLHVRHANGQEGWIATRQVFGWNDESVPVKTNSGGKDDAKSAKASEKSGSTSDGSAAGTHGKKGSLRGKKRSPQADESSDDPAPAKTKASRHKRSSNSDDSDNSDEKVSTARKRHAKAASDDTETKVSAASKRKRAKASEADAGDDSAAKKKDESDDTETKVSSTHRRRSHAVASAQKSSSPRKRVPKKTAISEDPNESSDQ